ncbi:hypothetical protein WJX73_003764 [Symbiochloris irregularis]|uniref:RING-type domain-containing protein n=1 Tax=Symbiochloris irregularis TaxID=706552 RepID=A0AAW1NXK8_9CHLO
MADCLACQEQPVVPLGCRCREGLCRSCHARHVAAKLEEGFAILQCLECRQPIQAEAGDAELAVLAQERGWKQCPHCHALCERTKGCKHIRCRCGLCFCYNCLAPKAARSEHKCSCNMTKQRSAEARKRREAKAAASAEAARQPARKRPRTAKQVLPAELARIKEAWNVSGAKAAGVSLDTAVHGFLGMVNAFADQNALQLGAEELVAAACRSPDLQLQQNDRLLGALLQVAARAGRIGCIELATTSQLVFFRTGFRPEGLDGELVTCRGRGRVF